MLAARDNPTTPEYTVHRGDALLKKWGKEIDRFARPHSIERILVSLESEYRFLDLARASRPKRYTTISCSNGAKCELIKAEINIPGKNASASGGGVRAGIFLDRESSTVTICFIGHHKHYSQFLRGDENLCFKKLLETHYPHLQKLLLS